MRLLARIAENAYKQVSSITPVITNWHDAAKYRYTILGMPWSSHTNGRENSVSAHKKHPANSIAVDNAGESYSMATPYLGT